MSGAAVDVPTDPRMGVTLRAFVTAVANDLGVPAEGGAQLVGFDLAELELAEALENLGNAEASGGFDAIVQIDKSPCQLAGEHSADSGLA